MPNREPIRCFEGEAKPHEPFWKFRDAIEGGEPELELYGYISEYSWWDDDVTPKKFRDDLYKFGQGGPITLRLNSYGGDVIAASVIATTIKEYPGKVTVQIDGVAASAATVVAIAGDQVRMQQTSYFMIHDPSMVFWMAQLNIEEMSRIVDALKAVKEGIVNAYESRTGLSRSRLAKLMAEETWMDCQKAVDLGFVDEVIKSEPKKTLEPVKNAAYVNALRNFVNVPASLLKSEPVNQSVEAESSDTAKLRAEAKILVGKE